LFILHAYFVLIYRNVDLGSLKHEAEYYGIKPLGVYIRYIYFKTYFKHFLLLSFVIILDFKNQCFSLFKTALLSSNVLTVRRLSLCEELDAASCGDVLFHGYLGPPCMMTFYQYLMPFVNI